MVVFLSLLLVFPFISCVDFLQQLLMCCARQQIESATLSESIEETATDRLSSGQLEVKCVGHKLRGIYDAIPESNPPILQSSNLRQSTDSAAKLSIFRLSRVSVSTPGQRWGSLCKIAAKCPSRRCLARHDQSQGHKYAVSKGLYPASSSASCLCLLPLPCSPASLSAIVWNLS